MVMNSHYAHFLSSDRGVMNFFWTGVYLFFVITGFLFAKTILFKDVDVFPYAVRRFFRIYPLYLFSLIIYYLITQDHPNKPFLLIKHIFFLNTVSYSPRKALFFNAAYWSLPVEIEFYAFVPLLVYATRRLGMKFLLSLFPIFFAIKFLLALLSNPDSPVPNTAYVLAHHLPGLMPEFTIGIILYVVYEKFLYGTWPLSSWHLLLIFMLGMVVLFSLSTFFVVYGYEGINTCIAANAFYTTGCSFAYALILLPFTLFSNGKNPRSYRLFFVSGSISYGTYLFHNIFPRMTDLVGIHIM